MKTGLRELLLSGLFFLIGIFTQELSPSWISLLAFLIAYLLVGLEVLYSAYLGMRQGNFFSEFFLMSIATFGAVALVEYPEAVAVMLFYQVGEYFQGKAVDHSRRSIQALLDIYPESATVLRDGEWIEVDPDEVEAGETILIKVGERVPLDAVVLEGQSSLNTAAMTGESVPRPVGPGSELISACINLTAVLKAKAIRPLEESHVSKILELVEDAGSRKSSQERFVTRFAKYYTPIVVAIAAALLLIPVLFLKQDLSVWAARALNFLVVSCPCALVISVPLSFFGALGSASKEGILVKGSDYLEKLSQCTQFVFDKTGTLTEGQFSVREFELAANSPYSESEIKSWVAAVEAHSNHPIAASLLAATENSGEALTITELKEIAGKGVTATIENKEIAIGNRSLMEDLSIHLDHLPTVPGSSEVWVAINGQFAARYLLSDQIRQGLKTTLENLRKEGIQSLDMLSGDQKENAESLGKKLGLNSVHASLLPQDKVAKMESFLSQKSGTIAYVGDGINDAPVLALADIGIAMGGLGQDAAIEAADVVIMDDKVEKILTTLRLSKRSVRIAKQNVIFALVIKVLILIFSAFGLASIWLAVFGDVGVTLLAVLNALRNLRPLD